MEFRVLGPLEVVGGEGPIRLGGPKQRALLAHLILRANRLVPADLLIDGLWGEDPPDTARNTLQTYVYRLRKLLGDGRIEGRGGGYVLTAGPEEIDAPRFEALVKQAKGAVGSDPALAAATFADALSLWRGPPLADLAEEPSLRGEIARLEELHLSATEHRIAAEIAAGGHSTVVSELEALTARYPLRERMWANLMLALYRLGRQAEALSTFERAREVLAEELGTEPSPELQQLHERILRRDPVLGGPERPRTTVRPSRVDLPPGTEFAGYRILSTLGRGGMSVVYLAEHDWLQRRVALKVLAPQLAEDDRFRERFVRESRLAASLDHPNVIPIYEAGASGGDLYIAMRYVEGTDLRTLLHEGGALEAARALAIVRQVAAGLDAAHEQGLVHRDVKPGNVLLARPRGSEAGEHVYLSDFGLTKRSVSDSGITGTGQFVGTLEYAAPEQFKGETLDPRTDVYSLGCVLFECLTGRPPFGGESDAALMYAHLQDPPPSVLADRPELPRDIDVVVTKAMAKAPADRYGTAGEVASEAARALGTPAAAAEAARPWLRWLVPTVAVVLALAAGVAIASLLRREVAQPEDRGSPTPAASPSPTAAPAFRTLERPLTPDEERLLTYIPEDLTADCSPLDRDAPVHGELAAVVCRAPDVEVLYELLPTRDEMDSAFQIGANTTRAPDGECATDRLAVAPYSVGGEPAGRVLCYTVERGLARQVVDEPARSHIEWTDENSLIYAHAVRNDLADLTLYEWWLTSAGPVIPGSNPSTVKKDVPEGVSGPRLRDGTYLAAPPGGCAGFADTTCTLHIDGDRYEAIFTGEPVNEAGTISLQKPNSVVFTPSTGYCFSSELVGPRRSPRPAVFEWTAVGGSVSFEHTSGGGCAGPLKLNDGSWIRAPAGTIVLEQGGKITLMEPGGFGIEQLTADAPATSKDPDWSPDGSRIVFAGAGGDDDLFVMDADGDALTQITDEAGAEFDPAWSPDGRRIAFVADEGGAGFQEGFSSSIVVIEPDGSGRTELLTRANEGLGWPAWSPDGGRIAFSSYTQHGFDLYVMDADGSALRTVYEQRESLLGMPVGWTPDGQRIVFWGEQAGKETLLSIKPDGTGVRELLEELPPRADTLTFDWSPDARWIIAAPRFDLTALTASPSFVYLIRADGSDAFIVAPSGSEVSWRPSSG